MCVLKFIQEYSDAFQTILATIAGFAGMIWWFLVRDRKPKAKIDLELEKIDLGDENCLLRVSVNVENVGKVLLKAEKTTIYVQQIFPLPTVDGKPFDFDLCEGSAEYSWPSLISNEDCSKTYVFEPGESGTMVFERVINRRDIPEVVSVYAHIDNKESSKSVGWDLSRIFKLESNHAK